jgi:hypothetical protein
LMSIIRTIIFHSDTRRNYGPPGMLANA